MTRHESVNFSFIFSEFDWFINTPKWVIRVDIDEWNQLQIEIYYWTRLYFNGFYSYAINIVFFSKDGTYFYRVPWISVQKKLIFSISPTLSINDAFTRSKRYNFEFCIINKEKFVIFYIQYKNMCHITEWKFFFIKTE